MSELSETPDELIDLLTSWALDFCPADAVNRYDEAGLEAHLRKVLLPRLIAAEASLAESQARAERAEGLLAEVYKQAGNSAPAERRHALTLGHWQQTKAKSDDATPPT